MSSQEDGPGGYPEEQPSQVGEGEGPDPRDEPKAPGADRAPDNEEGTATGNPGAAGSGNPDG